MLQSRNRRTHLFERNFIIKHKREIPLHRRIFSEGRELHRPQPGLIQLLQINLSQEDILPQLARRRHFRMDLPKLSHHRAIQ